MGLDVGLDVSLDLDLDLVEFSRKVDFFLVLISVFFS